MVVERRVGERDQSRSRVRRLVTPGSARFGGAVIAVRLGLALAVLSVLVGALPAVADVIPPRPTASAYAYDSAAASAHGAPENRPLAAAATAAVSGGFRTARENFADFRGFAVAAETATDAAAVGFRSDATHIFRDAAGHFAEDTAANRAIIRGAVDPANLRSTITLKDGATLSKYFQTLPDGTQAWAEVRNGTDITNGGLNVIPR